MGIFDFLKKPSQKAVEVRKVNLDEVGKLIDSFYKNLEKETSMKLVALREKLSDEKETMKKKIELLDETVPKIKNIPEHAVHMLQDNKKSYLLKIRAFFDSIVLPDSMEEVIKYGIKFEHHLDEFSKSTFRNYQIIQQFYGEKLNLISKNIVKIHSLIKQCQKIIMESGAEKVQEIKDAVNELKEKTKSKESLHRKIIEEKEKAKNVLNEIKDNENKIKELEEGPEYKRLGNLIADKKTAEKELGEVEMNPLKYFSTLNDALKKYERMSLDKELVKRYVDSPLNALEEDVELKIADIVQEIKKAIVNGKIELKQDKKEKILEACDSFDISYLKSFLQKKKELEKKIREISHHIESESVVKRIEACKDRLHKEKSEEEEVKNDIKKVEYDYGQINLAHMKKEIESKISDVMNDNITII